MNENLMIQTKQRLNSEFYLMNDDWLRDCIDYYVTERQNAQPSNREILEFVKAQWLLSDLRDIHNGIGSLPRNLSQQKYIVLSGTYILQVDQMYDISTPKYKQLQVIRNSNTANIEATEAENMMQQTYNPKPAEKRMIQLKLTDGIQNIVGIEYNYIPYFNEMLLPGYKVLIKGPVKCRNGVLMLKENNIKGIGGEVDDLLIPNALENILARALKLPENPDPYNDNAARTNKRNDTENATSDLLSGDFDINLDEISHIENLHRTTGTNQAPTQSVESRHSSSNNSTINSNTNRNDNNRNINTVVARDNPVVINDIDFDDNDDIFHSVDENYFMPQVDNTKNVANESENRNLVGPYRSLPKENAEFDDDDIIEIIEEQRPPVQKQSSAKIMPSFSKPLESKSEKFASTSSATMKKRQLASTSPETVVAKKGKRERMDEDSSKASTSVQEPEKICDFLCDVLLETVTKPTIKTVRGHITYMGKLSKSDRCWTFDCTISDGTGSLDVTFSNEVLENILGFDVKEFSRKKKLKKDPQIEQELRMSLRKAEETLKDLDALLELELSNAKKPIVMKIIPLSEQQKRIFEQQLSNRI